MGMGAGGAYCFSTAAGSCRETIVADDVIDSWPIKRVKIVLGEKCISGKEKR